MDDSSRTLATNANKKSRTSTTPNNHRGRQKSGEGDEACDKEAWETLSKSFRDVQSVLDENRGLIQQVNENHQSKLHGNMVKNVGLINEINGNISKVMGMYSNLNANFNNIVHQRRAGNDGNGRESSES